MSIYTKIEIQELNYFYREGLDKFYNGYRYYVCPIWDKKILAPKNIHEKCGECQMRFHISVLEMNNFKSWKEYHTKEERKIELNLLIKKFGYGKLTGFCE